VKVPKNEMEMPESIPISPIEHRSSNQVARVFISPKLDENLEIYDEFDDSDYQLTRKNSENFNQQTQENAQN
jgi:hypothetical protein